MVVRTLSYKKKRGGWRLRQLVDKGKELARGGDIDGAVVAFQQALELDPNLALDPGKEARRLAASGLVDKGRELAKQGAIREAMAAFEAAQASDPNLEDERRLSWRFSLLVWKPRGLCH